MRKHISVLGLWIRCSLYKILGILAIMSIVEYMLFYFTLNNELSVYEITGTFSRPEALIDRSGIFLCFATAFIVITVLLSIYGCQFGSKTSYTLQRLSINEKYVFLYQSVYNSFVYILFWSAQTVLCILMLKNYTSQAPTEFIGEQSVLLAFYRSTRLHPLLPFSDIMLWARNIILLIALSLGAAEFPYIQRRGKKSVTVIALALYTVVLWKQDISPLGSLISCILIAIAVLVSVSYQLFAKEETEDGNKDISY